MRAWYRFKPAKAVEAILWLANREPGGKIDFYHIVKVLYFADKYHLNEYGRPILGDTYEAMPHGPVGRHLYALLKGDEIAIQSLDADERRNVSESLPFRVFDRYWVKAEEGANTSLFSESDEEALEWAFSTYAHRSFSDLEELTHSDPAWRLAAEYGRSIDYEDMIEGCSALKNKKVNEIRAEAPYLAFARSAKKAQST